MALPVRNSLQRRIVLLVVVGMFLMLTSLGISAWLAVTESTRRVLQERLALAQTTADHLSYTLNQNLARLEEIAFAEGVNLEDGNPTPEERALHNAYLASIFRDGVFIIDRDGNVLWTEPASSGWLNSNVYSYPHIKASLVTGKPAVSNVFALQPSGRQMVSAVVPIKNRQGNIVGAVGGYIDPTGSTLRDLLQPVRLSGAYIDVVDANGVVVASTKDERILQSSDHGNVLAGLIDRKGSTVSTCHSCHEVAREQRRDAEVMAFASLDSPSWGVAVRQSEPEALAPVRSLQQRFILFSVILVAMGLPLTWALGRSLVRPLGVLTAAARKISKGNLDDPIPNLGQDEIGMLARDLDAMRLELRDSLEEIRQWNHELEARVQERTRQLQESKDHLQTLYKEIQQKEAARGELLHKVIAAQEDERKRIARELHDETSQALAALVMTLDSAAAADSSDTARSKLLHMKELAVRTLDELHQIILDLRPSMLDDLGLVSAIRWYAESRLQSQGVKVSFETSGSEERLPTQMETALFRVVQEAITNIARHAEADDVVISLEFNHSAVAIEIEDDGRGFDISSLSPPKDRSRGLGLMGMKERIGLLDGTLTIDSEPGQGTRLSIKVPLPEKDVAGAQDTRTHS